MCLRSQAQRRDGYFFIVTSLAFRAKLERVATLEGFAEKDFTNSSGYYLNQISFYLKMIKSGFCQVRVPSIHCGLLGSSRLNEPIFNDWPKPFVVRVQHLSLTLYKKNTSKPRPP